MGNNDSEVRDDAPVEEVPVPPPKEEKPAKAKASIKWGKAGIRCQSCRKIITKTSDKEKVPSHCPDCHSSALVAE